ncbi:Clas107 [Clostera anastomosis granulovirus B]|uniref:Clas107 n=1 Tax=Clostera anastomosis granulovirus B TaxID=1986290 RepID=A0A0K0WSA7_9BBAC|nr:Clas107 [Clostera anastomosis granulovirus B]AKS25450.1 Clas107 [Clostera anastomosis granulovirus B]
MEVKDKKDEQQKSVEFPPFKLKTVIEKTVQNAYSKDWSKTRNGKTWHMRHTKKTW